MRRKRYVGTILILATLLLNVTIAQAQDSVGTYKVFPLTQRGMGDSSQVNNSHDYYTPCYTSSCTYYRYYHQYPNTYYPYPPRPVPSQPSYQPVPTPYTYQYPNPTPYSRYSPYANTRPSLQYPTGYNYGGNPATTYTIPYWVYASWMQFMLENARPPDYIYNAPSPIPGQQELQTEISIATNNPTQTQPAPNPNAPYSDMYGVYQVNESGSVQYVY